MTAIATDSRCATAVGRPARRRPGATAPATAADPARAGGAIPWVVLVLAVVGAVGVVGTAGGGGADVATAAGGSAPLAAGDEGGGAAVGEPSGEASAAATVTLGEGETAWEALKPHTPAGMRHEVFVHEVVQANGVDARELRPGDVLVVPRVDR